MDQVPAATKAIEDFFARYTGCLTAGDIEGLVDIYNYPWIGRLVFENLDGSGSPVGMEHNAYQVVTLPDGTRRIAVSTPLDAYNPDAQTGVEESGV